MAVGEDESMFRDLCENAHDLIQSVSPEGKFLYVNRSWMRTLGYDSEDLQHLDVFDVIHPESHEHCREVMGRVLAGGEAVEIEATFLTKDGRKVEVEGSASCRFEEGRAVSTRGIFRDVTERRRSREQLDRFFSLSLDLLCIAGTDGYFKQINPAFEKILGYSREELLSRSFLEFVHPDDKEDTVRQVERLAEGLNVVNFTNRYRAADGSWRWLDWRSAPMQELGLIYAVARDVTEERRNQELLKSQAKELARSNADLEQFAYVASHDLRAPLRSIAGLADWIEEELGGAASGKAIENLRQLRSRVRRMETLTEDILLYSRAGRDTVKPTRVDTTELIAGLLELLAPPEGFVVTVEPGMPVIETPRAPLEQVFRNLIGNAIKHHDRSTGRITVSGREKGDFIEFSVSNDGPPIPAEFQERIWKMFAKLESKDEVEGTGLGLAIVKRIVETQGGRAWVESGNGRGVTFRFTWPEHPVGQD